MKSRLRENERGGFFLAVLGLLVAVIALGAGIWANWKCISPAALNERTGAWSSVLAYGAKGDGSNDTDAFHAAMKAGRRVYVPAGTYRVNLDLSAVSDANGMILMGDGYGNGSNGTVLRGYDETKPIIRGEFSASSSVRKLEFRDLVLSQTGGTEAPGNDGMRFRYVYEVVYDKVYFINTGGWCLNLESCVAHSMYNCQFYKGSARRGLGGLKASGQSNLLNVIGGRFTGSGANDPSPAFHLEQIAGVRFFGCSVESWGTGVFLDNQKGIIVDISIDAYFEENNLSDVKVGTKEGSAVTPVIGVSVRGTFAGPVDKRGNTLQLWGDRLSGVKLENAYVSNRESVVDVAKDDALLDGVQIGPLFHDGVPLLKGKSRPGIRLLDGTLSTSP